MKNPRTALPLVPCVALLLAATALQVAADTRYVDLNNLAPSPPYVTWGSAATNIQDAVDASIAGDEIVVNDGIYEVGARDDMYGMSNRVAVTVPVTVRSLNGPAVTIIRGYQVPGLTNGAEAVRCVYLTNGAVLAGFTLTNGATQGEGGGYLQNGGGVRCESEDAMLTNCVLVGNSASAGGGASYHGTLRDCLLAGNLANTGAGIYQGMLSNCTLTGNQASYAGGAAAYGALLNCVLTNNTSGGGGGGAYSCNMTNCVVTANKAVAGGGGAVSCVLSNCLITANTANNGGGASGGTLYNCVVRSNSVFGTANSSGGGTYSSTVYSSLIHGNTAAPFGGAASMGTLFNCTIIGNSASASGGGGYQARFNNCIVYYNSASDGNFDAFCTLNYCCTTPFPARGTNNLIADPQLASLTHLSAGSPCRGTGSALFTGGVDFDGETWANPPSIGCDEYSSGSVTGALNVALLPAYTNVAVGFSVDFLALIDGRTSGSSWDFGDGTVLPNRPSTAHAWGTPGDYNVVLRAYNESYAAGLAATVTVHVVSQPIHYVAVDSASPAAPFISWSTAATNIQDAVDAAVVPGALVLVGDGLYEAGARAVAGTSNRLAITTPLVVRGLNSPERTIIRGYQVPGTVTGDLAIRCAYLANGARLEGLTLTNGATASGGNGGGVWCESAGAVLSNCIVSGSFAQNGGGACYGTLDHCTLITNSAVSYGGGAYYACLNDCTLTVNSASAGGGGYYATFNDCTLTGNHASNGGGGYYGQFNHCRLTENSATMGGGAYYAAVNDCTLTANSAQSGGAVYYGTAVNSTLIGNSAGGGGGSFYTVLANCLLATNSATGSGGGANFGSLTNCTLTANTAQNGGGMYNSKITNCTLTANSASALGGGANSGTLVNCVVTGNRANSAGGGAYSATLNNCLVLSNTAPTGGGASSCSLNNCTLVANVASSSGGGTTAGSLINCIVYYNTAPTGSNYASGASFNCSCTMPLPGSSSGCFTNAPLFVNRAAGNFHLQSNSPCIDVGNNTYVKGPIDLDGNPRVSGGTIDVGAYEFQALDPFHAWLSSFGLPTDGSADSIDSDHDGLSNWQEWVCGTNPTNALSALRMVSASPTTTNVMVSWQSVAGMSYVLQRSASLSTPFTLLATNILGQAGTTTYADTNRVSSSPLFYRIGVNSP